MMKLPPPIRFLITPLVFVGILAVACSTANVSVEPTPARPLASVTPVAPLSTNTVVPTKIVIVNTATPTLTPQPSPTASASVVAPVASTPTHLDRIVSPGSDQIPGILNNPFSVPRTGDIVAKTMEEGHPTGFVRITFEGDRQPIDQAAYLKYHDQTISVDGRFRLVVRNNVTVLSYVTSEDAPPGTVALAEGRKKIEGPAIVDGNGWYGAVVQHRREILLFESYNSHHQGVAFVSPPDFASIDSIAWHTREYNGALKKWYVPDPRHIDKPDWQADVVNELVLSVRTIEDKRQLYRLSPVTVYPLPPIIARDCGVRTHFLNDCMIKFYRSMPKELTLISDHGDYAASVVRKE